VVNCVAVVYSITSRTSFEHAQGCVAGIPLEREDIPLYFPITLIGNKGDFEDQREVQTVERV
jgi:GTPase SAR1 family protein